MTRKGNIEIQYTGNLPEDECFPLARAIIAGKTALSEREMRWIAASAEADEGPREDEIYAALLAGTATVNGHTVHLA